MGGGAVRPEGGVIDRESQKTPEKAGWSWKANEAGQGGVVLAKWQTGLSALCSERVSAERKARKLEVGVGVLRGRCPCEGCC